MLKLEKVINYTEIEVMGETVKVAESLDTMEKFAIIATALSAANVNGLLNRMIYESAFSALVVLKYSDLEIEGMGTLTLPDLYDLLDTNGIVSTIIEAIPANEYSTLSEYASIAYQEMKESINSAAAMTENMIQEILKLLIAQYPEALNNKEEFN